MKYLRYIPFLETTVWCREKYVYIKCISKSGFQNFYPEPEVCY